ncbi:MAG: class II aldolase/adducin family protein [Planctomycetes bacterium]|nr:class II aldolase/adducin family protein [Planctomycetota bacterium]
MSWSDEEAALRGAVCQVARMAYDKGLITNVDGNFSVRLGDRGILITPAGAPKAFLSPEQIAHIDLNGNVVSGDTRPSTEVTMHVTAYRERPDMRAICHAHPKHAVAFTLAGLSLDLCVIPEVVVTLGTIPTAPYGTPGTQELPDSLRETIRCSDVVLLERHGALTLGTSLIDAFRKLEVIEHTATILYYARTLGGVKELSPEQVQKLLDTRARLGVKTQNTLCSKCGADVDGGPYDCKP